MSRQTIPPGPRTTRIRELPVDPAARKDSQLEYTTLGRIGLVVSDRYLGGTWHDIRTGERPAALLRDAWFRPAAGPAPRRPADHRPEFRAVARTPRGEQAGDRGKAPGPRPHPRHRPRDDHRRAA